MNKVEGKNIRIAGQKGYSRERERERERENTVVFLEFTIAQTTVSKLAAFTYKSQTIIFQSSNIFHDFLNLIDIRPIFSLSFQDHFPLSFMVCKRSNVFYANRNRKLSI